MRERFNKLLSLHCDDAGQATIEYTLILAVFGIPMVLLCRVLLSILVEHYRMVTFLETLPYP